MNAGAWGGETWRHVIEVDVLDRRGMRRTRKPADYEIGYRSVKGPDNEWFIGAQLEFERTPGVNTDAIRDLLDKRRETQPIGEWSCGSVFTNPPDDHAARLDRRRGAQGVSHRRRIGIREARQFHHQSRQRARRRHRGADRARAPHRRRRFAASSCTPKFASSERLHEPAHPEFKRFGASSPPRISARWRCCSAAIRASGRSRC